MSGISLADLEARIAYQDDAIDQLSDVIRDQWQAIDNLRQELQRMQRRVEELENNEEQPPNTRPPHY